MSDFYEMETFSKLIPLFQPMARMRLYCILSFNNSHSANPISVILNSHHASQQQYQQAQFYPPVPSFNNARSVTQPSPMFFSMPYNSGFVVGLLQCILQ
uniref:Uncharacterized protein n=1 Tax=Ditylenchus dipsaci TaxID=166011 RepID=A0A915CTE2_9BILA